MYPGWSLNDVPRKIRDASSNKVYFGSIVQPNFPFKGWGRRHCKLEKAMNYYLVVTIGVPLSSTRLDWSVKTRSMQEGFLFVLKFVGSLIN